MTVRLTPARNKCCARKSLPLCSLRPQQTKEYNMSSLDQLTAGAWVVDTSHSSIGFTARHLMVSKVRGSFTDFAGALTVGTDPLDSSVSATVQVASVTTGDAGRDGHLLGEDFFDAATFPTMTLQSTGIDRHGDDYVLHADLTIKGVTRAVDFELEFDGVATDPWGNTKAGFSAETEVSRKDFGLEWNVALEAGGVLVGDKVKIHLDVQAAKAQ
jgi:polyisoprenoid-binding protein YceI